MYGNLFYNYGFRVGGLPGTSKLSINTRQNGDAYPANITIMDQITGHVFCIVSTHPTATIERYLPKKYSISARLVVLASDKTGTYNAVVADNVQADLVP